MLHLAVKARLPIIRVSTDDAVNVEAVLSTLVGKAVSRITLTTGSEISVGNEIQSLAPQGVYFWYRPPSYNWIHAYSKLATKGVSLILVNAELEGDLEALSFDAGALTAPPAMLAAFVTKHGAEKDKEKLLTALSGLSFKSVVELSKLAMTEYGVFSSEAIRAVRRRVYGGVEGIEEVSTDYAYYNPPSELVAWIQVDGRLLQVGAPAHLRPKGLLFDGPAGTGKTMGAKYIAKTLQLPLYKVDIATLLSKYVGETNKNLSRVLSTVESLSPCVLLFDEVEKLFNTNDDEGVIQRVLSQLLWWMQEHSSNVLTIMTTNKGKAIPQELIRPGRIDKKILFAPLSIVEGQKFLIDLSKSLGVTGVTFSVKSPCTPALLTEWVINEAKSQYLAKHKTKG